MATSLLLWLCTLALLLGLAICVGRVVTGDWRGILVDTRNKLSVARLQLLLWTAFVLSAWLAAVLANVAAGAPDPLGISVPQGLWAAMGVSTASLAAAPYVLKRQPGTLARNASAGAASWRDLVSDEVDGFDHLVDLGKLQMLLVTGVLLVAYGVALADRLRRDPAAVHVLPSVNDAFVILLGISHAGYLAKKRAPRTGAAKAASSRA
jgi:cell division protein FtsL